jgi:hypothetical protein
VSKAWIVISINAAMFVVEMGAGHLAGSQALKADALDFLGDTLTYGLSLAVIGLSIRPRSLAALDAGPLGALIRFSDGAGEPPPRHRRKHAAWRSTNGIGRLVRKASGKHTSAASFTLHVGDFGSDDVTVVKAYRVFSVTSPLSFAIVDKPQPGQIALLQDELGMPTLIHLADTEADA